VNGCSVHERGKVLYPVCVREVNFKCLFVHVCEMCSMSALYSVRERERGIGIYSFLWVCVCVCVCQVSSLLMRETQLLADRRELQRQLDKLKLEITRRAGLVMAVPGSSSLPPPPPAPHPFHFSASTPFPADPLTPAMNIGGRGWESAIAGLRQSIRQARQQIEETQQAHHHTTTSVTSLKQPFTE
jgi:hypothetical protein